MQVAVWVLSISAAVSVIGLGRLWQLRNRPGAPSLAIAIASVAFWSVTYALEISQPGLAVKLFWAKAEYLGIEFAPVGIFLFSLEYTGRARWNIHWRLLLISLIPIATLLLAATNDWHHFIWAQVQLSDGQLFAPLDVTHAGPFWISAVYAYGLLLAATYFLLRLVLQPHSLYRTQTAIMLAGMVVPWVGNFIYLSGLNPVPHLDWTPLAFAITNVALSVSFMRYRMLDISPVAYEAIVRAMSDAAIVLDPLGRIIEANPAAERMLQQPASRLLGQNLEQSAPTLAEAARQPGQPEAAAREITLGPNGLRHTYTLRLAPVKDRRGRDTGHLLLLADITDLKRAQEQMQLQATALESAENGIVITDPKGRILWVNPAFSRLTGYSREEVLGENPRLLKSGEHAPEFYKTLWDTVLGGEVWRGEMINRRKDGSYYHEEMTITPLKPAGGPPAYFIAIKQDISARKQAEAELQSAHEAAVQANRLKTQLLANVSHDLRTPLGAILGFADMLRSGVYGDLNAEQSGAAGEIIDSVNQLLLFVNNLIGQAQLETGRIVLKHRPFNPAELIEVARSTGSLLAGKKGLHLAFDVSPELPHAVPGDLYWLRQIVLNLVNNAVKFTEHGQVTVRLLRPSAAEWGIQVADTGAGIPSEAQATIFDAFQQVDGSATRKYGGSGLGLAIVKELTTLMEGRIDLKSAVGQGSTFTIYLPLTAPQEKTV